MSASQSPTARLSTRIRANSPTGARALEGDLPPLVLGRYKLLRRLGAGASGTVWLAHDERLDREVAVKAVPRERVIGGRLQREARAAARLAHPGIVMLYEAAVDEDGAYLVSELVRGPTLDELLGSGRLSDRDVLEIAIALCDALAYAHSQGVVHRDVKPSNVLVPERPATPAGLAKLTDFGVARVIGGDSLTRTGDVIGTAAYMSPEQAEGREAGAPADLYALALVTYEALTGLNPVRTTIAAERARRLGAHLPPLRRQRRELPRELGRAIDLALRPKPRERGTIEELREALKETHGLVGDAPGVVESPWPLRGGGPQEAEPLAPQATHDEAHAGDPDADAPERQPIPTSARVLAGIAAGATAAWIMAHALAPAGIAPVAAAVLAAMLVVALPRIGWLTVVGFLTVAAGIQGRPGAAILLMTAGMLPVALLPRDGRSWPLAAGAPALGVIGLAGAWPAIAARGGGPWRRAALGGCGWVWLVLAAPVNGAGLYLTQRHGVPPVSSWGGSLRQTVELVLRPILTSGVLAAAPVWALASLTLPWLVRGRSLPVDIALVTAWAAVAVSASTTAIQLAHPGHVPLSQGTAVLGAIFGAVIALAPGLAGAVRARA